MALKSVDSKLGRKNDGQNNHTYSGNGLCMSEKTLLGPKKTLINPSIIRLFPY